MAQPSHILVSGRASCSYTPQCLNLPMIGMESRIASPRIPEADGRGECDYYRFEIFQLRFDWLRADPMHFLSGRA